MKSKTKRAVLSVCALVLVVAATVGGTLAWIRATDAPVTNTFTVGDINIDLDESDDLDLKIVPGREIAKDPKVTVKAESEACWLFVKIDKSENFDSFFEPYTIASGWTRLTKDKDNNDMTDIVYYREVSAGNSDQSFYVLGDVTNPFSAGEATNENGSVAVKTTVTKTMINALTDDTMPKLTFTAYAAQHENVATAAAAWEIAKTPDE